MVTLPVNLIHFPSAKVDNSAITARLEQIRQARVAKSPVFPDRSKVVEALRAKKLAKDTADCTKQGGNMAGDQCVIPPPPAPAPEPTPQPVYQAPVVVNDGSAKMFIYSHESGNDPAKWNTSGCLGLGQACPASKLLAVCPQEDYACEDQFFTNYMLQRYGTWENAKAFWLRIDARPYAGNWW